MPAGTMAAPVSGETADKQTLSQLTRPCLFETSGSPCYHVNGGILSIKDARERIEVKRGSVRQTK